MAAQRLLIVMVLACLSQGVAQAQPVAIPRWVRASSMAGVTTTTAAQPGWQALENRDQGASASAILDTMRLAKNIPPLLKANKRILTHKTIRPSSAKSAGRLQALRVLQALQAASLVYDWYAGNLTQRDLQMQAAQMAASSAASAATFAGMVYIAGTIGTASTGTAIASLSGAAYASATAAWWGGGSIAAGGFGVAGGTMIMTGGAAIVAISVGYGVYKAWDYLDPAQRDAMNMMVEGLLKRDDLTDSSSPHGAMIVNHSRQLRERQRLQSAVTRK